VRGPVTVGKIVPGPKKKEFVKDPSRFVTVPAVARVRHKVLLDRLKEAEGLANESPLNKIEKVHGGGRTGVITSSAAFNYVMDAAEEMKLSVDVLKLGFSHPVPAEKVIRFVKGHGSIVIAEELEPILENAVRAIAQHASLGTRIVGKADGAFPRLYEFDQTIVSRGLRTALSMAQGDGQEEAAEPQELPERPPVLCAGCPHSATYFAVNKATNRKAIFASDIGCYTLGLAPPYNAADFLVCMGSSVGSAGGLAKVNDQPVIAFIGDSTFFHAGIPGLINAVHNGHRFLLMILDNRTTAMTGHQPHPGSEKGPACCDITAVSIEEVVKGCGVKWLKVVDPYELKATVDAVKEALEQPRVSVIIARRECALIAERDAQGAILRKHFIDQEACKKCRTCVDKFQCPAISSIDKVQTIDKSLCAGCGVCAQVCPYKAIKEAK
jgi:indolepyruvate ferredoxin oxidoreductase alpha subunit